MVWVYDLSALPQLGAPYGVCGRLSVWDCERVERASNLRLSLRRALVLAPDCRSGAPPSGPGSTRAPAGVWGPYGTTPLAHPIVRSSRTFVSVRAPAWEGLRPPLVRPLAHQCASTQVGCGSRPNRLLGSFGRLVLRTSVRRLLRNRVWLLACACTLWSYGPPCRSSRSLGRH